MSEAVHAFFRDLRPTLAIAHRGGAALYPENTLLAFERALRDHAADALELDLHATRDGELVVLHDPTLERTTDGEGPVAERTLAELARLDAGARFSRDGGSTFPYRGQGVRIPTFVELLRAFPGVPLNVELKADAPGLEDLVAQVLRREDASDRVCLGSEHDALALRLLRAAPEVCPFYPRDALTRAIMALKTGAPLPDEPYLVLDMPLEHHGLRLVDAELVARAAAAGRWVNVWTVDDPSDMQALAAWKTGGIMTDRPDRLREVLGR